MSRLLLATLLLVAGCASQQGPRAADPAAEARPQRKEVIRSVLPSNLRLQVFQDGKAIRAASAVVIARAEAEGDRPVTAWVLTNAHVVAPPAPDGEFRIEALVDGVDGIERLPARVLAAGQAPDWDLALLEVPGLDLPAARLSSDAGMEIGDEVVAVAAPFGQALSVSTGIVSQVTRQEDGAVWEFKTDAPIGYGASGGGIYRIPDGALLAIVEGYRTAKVSFPVAGRSYSFDVPMPGETFAAPAAKVRAFLASRGWAHLLEGQK